MSALLALSAGGLLVACDDGATAPSPTAVRAQISSDLTYVLTQSKDAGDASTAVLPTLPSQVDVALRIASFKYPALGKLADVAAKAGRAPTDPVPTEDTFNPDEAATWLNDNIFTDANHVGGGVYKVPASLACTVTTYDDTTGAESTSLDADCATKFDTAELRIRVEQNNGTLKFAIQVDANHDEPLEITLAHTKIAASVNLDDASDAMQALAIAFGEEQPNVALAGAVTASLEVPGEKHVKASLTVDRAVSVKVAENGENLDGDTATRFATAAAPVIAVELDGVAKTGSGALGLGATTVHTPGIVDPDFPEPSNDIDLGGATATASFAEGAPLAITNISLGQHTTTVKENGATTLSIDLNANDGRAFSASITGDDVSTTVAVTPKLELAIVDTNSSDRYPISHVLLDGATPTLAASTTTDQLKLVSGHLAITTNPAEGSLTVDAGQCFAETEVEDATTLELYNQWVSQTCN